ncbi:MAG: autotransporter domain-containing protein [Burkholderiaceae bacterium]
MFIKTGESSKPVIMGSRSVLDNAGTVGGPSVDIGVSASGSTSSVKVFNHNGGHIEGKSFGVRLWSGYPTIENTGAGSIIRSDGVAIEYIDQGGNSTITNSGGATILGGNIGIHLQRGGTIKNGAGSTIKATGTSTGDCGTGGSCSIYVNPDTSSSDLSSSSTILENAGTIIGNVQLDPLAHNEVTLWAGSSIQGNLSIDSDRDHSYSALHLDGAAGTTQLFSQAVTGNTTYFGRVIKQGDGTWILDRPLALGSGLDPAFNGVEINGGTLQIGKGGTEGPSVMRSVYASGGGRLLFNRSDDVIFDTSFTGGGTLVQAGTGLLTLSLRHNSFAGLLAINAGSRMQIANGSPPASSTTCCGGNYLAVNVANDGELTFKSDYAINVAGGISGTGSIIQDGASYLTLSGDNTYTGATIINSGGMFARRGLAGDVVINAAGTYWAGTLDPVGYVPRIAGSLYNAGHFVLSQGDFRTGGGTVNASDYVIGGDYIQSSTGTFSVTLGDKLDITGAATIEGGALEVTGSAYGYVANTHTDVLTAAGGVTGTFDRLVKGSGVVFTSSTIHYDANSVWLDTSGLNVTVAAVGDGIGYTPASMSSAQRVQGAFEQLNNRIATGTLAGVSGEFLHSAGQFQRAPTIAAAQASLRSLSGQMHAASAAMTFRAIDTGNQALSDHLDGLRDGNTGIGMWTQQLGGSGGMARSGFDGIGFQLDGWLVGNDYRIGHSGVAGFAFGQGLGRQQLEHGLDHDDSRRSEGMLYAGVTNGSWYTQGRLGFGHFSQDTSRQLLLGEDADGVWARYDGRYQAAYGESGLHLGRGNGHIAPFVSLEYARSDRDAFVEEGAGGFGLRSDAQAIDRWQAGVGLRGTRHWDFAEGRALNFGAHAQWRRTFASNGDNVNASFVGLQQWSPLVGIGLSRYSGVFGIDLDARFSPRATMKFSYDYENGQYDSAQGLSASFNMAF